MGCGCGCGCYCYIGLHSIQLIGLFFVSFVIDDEWGSLLGVEPLQKEVGG